MNISAGQADAHKLLYRRATTRLLDWSAHNMYSDGLYKKSNPFQAKLSQRCRFTRIERRASDFLQFHWASFSSLWYDESDISISLLSNLLYQRFAYVFSLLDFTKNPNRVAESAPKNLQSHVAPERRDNFLCVKVFGMGMESIAVGMMTAAIFCLLS